MKLVTADRCVAWVDLSRLLWVLAIRTESKLYFTEVINLLFHTFHRVYEFFYKQSARHKVCYVTKQAYTIFSPEFIFERGITNFLLFVERMRRVLICYIVTSIVWLLVDIISGRSSLLSCFPQGHGIDNCVWLMIAISIANFSCYRLSKTAGSLRFRLQLTRRLWWAET